MSDQNKLDPILVVVALAFIGFAGWALFGTNHLGTQMALLTDTPSARNELRANYGGQFLMFGVFFLLAARAQAHRASAYLLLTLGVGGLALGRLYAIVLDGRANNFLTTLLIGEIALFGVCFWRYRSVRAASS